MAIGGPWRDVPGDDSRHHCSTAAARRLVPIGDVEHGRLSSVCPRKIKRLGGKIRAVVYCMYKSENEYKKPLRCHDCCTLIASPEFNLPPLRK